MDQDIRAVDVGGPEILTHREIARLAFTALGKRERITSVPIWVMRAVVAVTRAFNRHQGGLLAFFTEAMTADAVAPRAGSRRLAQHFQELSTHAEAGEGMEEET